MVEGCWYILEKEYASMEEKVVKILRNVRISVNYTDEKASGSNFEGVCREEN